MTAKPTLGQVVKEAMDLSDQMKANGASWEDRCHGIENVVRAHWPYTREWHYDCATCSDTGWEPGTCTPETPCGRPFRLPQQRADDYTGRGRCAPGHAYVQPCFCARGRVFQRSVFEAPTAARPEEFVAAGKTAKGFTRAGRR